MEVKRARSIPVIAHNAHPQGNAKMVSAKQGLTWKVDAPRVFLASTTETIVNYARILLQLL
jgi:hypothetical protein